MLGYKMAALKKLSASAWKMSIFVIFFRKKREFFAGDKLTGAKITLSLLAVNFEDCWWPMQTIWISDEAPQNVGLHLRSKLFDIQIIYQQKKMGGTMNFLKILKETNIWKNYPACKELSSNLVRGLLQSNLSLRQPTMYDVIWENQSYGGIN